MIRNISYISYVSVRRQYTLIQFITIMELQTLEKQNLSLLSESKPRLCSKKNHKNPNHEIWSAQPLALYAKNKFF